MVVTEVPKLRRCCFCIPLRRGLLFWSYLHMVATITMGVYGVYMCTTWLILCNSHNTCDNYNIFFSSVIALHLNVVVNGILSGLLIYGAHKKNHQLLKVQYYGATVSIITYTIIIISVVAVLIKINRQLVTSESWFETLRNVLFVGVLHTAYILIQLYVIVLVRSEVLKLRDNQQFQFTNNATDSEANCTLYVDNKEKSNPAEQ